MSIDKNNIDQIFSDAAHSQKAPQYDAAYWAEMNAMLNKKDASKRAFVLWAFGGSAIFAALFLSLFIVNMNLDQSEKHSLQKSFTSALDNDSSKDIVNRESKEKESKEKIGLKNENITTDRNAHQLPEIQSDQLNKKDVIYAGEPDQIKFSTNNSSELYLKAPSEKKIRTNSETTLSELSESDELNNENSLSEDNIAEQNITDEEPLDNNDVQLLPFDPKNSIDQKEADSPFKSLLKYKPKPSLMVFAKLNGGLMENYKTSRPYESGLVDLSLNLEMNFDGLLLRSGIGAQLTNNADLILSKRVKVYGFGVVNHQNDLSYQSLFDIYIPLEIGYKFKATSFGIGVQANYLLTTGMDLNFYEDHNLMRTEKFSGNKDGLNTFSTQGYVWLEHQLSSRFSLGLKVGTNISGRIKDSAYFNNSATTNPIYGQLSLRFNIIQ